ncbi:MAG: hypothetical protein ACLUG4_04765 [Bacilli bacterium]|nr:hypothetical protein [Staphylococcus sp.]
MKKQKIVLLVILITSVILLFIPTIFLSASSFYSSILSLLEDFLIVLPFTLLGIIGVSVSLKKLLENI